MRLVLSYKPSGININEHMIRIKDKCGPIMWDASYLGSYILLY